MRVEDRPLGIELLALLIVVSDLHVGAAPHLAPVGRQLAEQQPQQRRLARAVRPDQADPIAAHDARRETSATTCFDPNALLTVVGFEDELTGRSAPLDLQTDRARLLAPRRPLLHAWPSARAPALRSASAAP